MKKQLLLVWSFSIAMAIHAQVINIPADYSTIQLGINAANPGDTVLVADGVYYEQINFLGKKPLTVASHFLMDGDTNHINNTVIDGSQLPDPDYASVVYFKSNEDTTSILNGFTITNGKGTVISDFNVIRIGGGIFIYSSGAKIINNKIIYNHIDDGGTTVNWLEGGGIGTRWSESTEYLVIESNQISHNSAYSATTGLWGGGIFLCPHYSTRFAKNEFSYNTGQTDALNHEADGGAIYLYNNINLITGNKFHHNSLIAMNNGYATGAAVVLWYGQIDFNNNEVYENEALAANSQRRGGLSIYNMSEACYVTNNSFIENNGTPLEIRDNTGNMNGNTAFVDNNLLMNNEGTDGGGAFIDVKAILRNNIFSGNHAIYYGGAVYIDQLYNFPFSNLVILINNTFTQNVSELKGGAIFSQNSNPWVMNTIFYEDVAEVDGTEINLSSPENYVSLAGCNIDLSMVNGDYFDMGGNINVNPGFTDDTCHISDASPCEDSGIIAAESDGNLYVAPFVDFEGTFRPYHNGYDIGADECDIITGISNPFVSNPGNIMIRTSPNPVKDVVTISYSLESDSRVSLSLYDIQGRLVEKLLEEDQLTGNHQGFFNMSDLKSGTYFFRMTSGGQPSVSVGKMLKL